MKVIHEDKQVLDARLAAVDYATGQPADKFWSCARTMERYLLAGILPGDKEKKAE